MRHFDGDIRTGLTKGLKLDLTQEAVIKKKTSRSLQGTPRATEMSGVNKQTDKQVACNIRPTKATRGLVA